MTPPFSCSMSLRYDTAYFDDTKIQKQNNSEIQMSANLDNDTTSELPAETNKKELEKVFSELFSQYNYLSTNILADLSKITDETFSEEKLISYNDIKINNLYKSVKKAFEENYDKSTETLNLDNAIERAKQYHSGGGVEAFNDKSKIQTIEDILKSDKDSGLSNEKKILNYFKNKLNEYEKIDKKTAKEELIKDFNRILAQTSDVDKKLLLPVLLTVLKNVKTVATFFNSFKNIKCKTECANSVSNEELSSIDYKVMRSLIQINMSAQRISEYLEFIDKEYQEFYKNNKEIIDTVIYKRQNGIPLNPNSDEVIISQQIDKYLGEYISLQAAIIANDNLTDKEKEDFTNKITETQRQYPAYQLYLESLAQFVNDNKMSLNIGEEKLEQLKNYLDKATDGEYSKAVEALAEKNSAIDSNTGGFKTPNREEIIKRGQKAEELKQQYVVSDESEQKKFVIENSDSSISPSNSAETSVSAENFDTNVLFAVVKNEVDFITADILKKAADIYKMSSLAEQFNVLRAATGKFFNKVLEVSDKGIIDDFLKSGNKCASYNQTQMAIKVLDEKQDKNDAA